MQNVCFSIAIKHRTNASRNIVLTKEAANLTISSFFIYLSLNNARGCIPQTMGNAAHADTTLSMTGIA